MIHIYILRFLSNKLAHELITRVEKVSCQNHCKSKRTEYWWC